MPYITQEQRELIEEGALEDTDLNVGELNYVISSMLSRWLARPGRENYAGINALIGVLECAKLELYRRVAAPYEDEKIELNGDVY